MHGVLVIDKPQGCTSHDVVDRIRSLTRIRKVGHAGTLDPMATGVLIVLVGRQATRRQADFLQGDKAYRGTIRFGLTTDSQDAEGEPVERRAADHLTESAVRAALEAFRGPIEQLPPMASAVKHRGKPLYAYHRQGQAVQREPRTVTIHQLELLAFRPGSEPEADIEATVSKGTYIRTLAHDLGRHLEVGGHLTALRRTRSGTVTLARAHRLADLEQLSPRQLQERLHTPEALLEGTS